MKDARLIALAPDAVRLLVDMAAKLEKIQRWFDSNGHDSGEVAALRTVRRYPAWTVPGDPHA